LPSSSQLEVMEGDIRDLGAVRRAMQGITHVQHLAAQVSVQVSVENPILSETINISGFVNVLDSAYRAGVQRMVYASSAAVYGIPEQLPLTEDSPTQGLSPYGLERLVNDQYATLFRRLLHFPTLGLRYFNVYGPRQDPRSPYAGVISKFLDNIRAGAPLRVFGDSLQTRDFIFVKDVARVNVRALQSELTGVCNVATGTSVTLREMIAALSFCVGKPLEVHYDAPREGDIRHSATRVDFLRESLGIQAATELRQGLAELVKHDV
jgi:UDP-glucose 4-epimerase